MIKKIILTIVLILFIIFIQSYVFSFETCNLSLRGTPVQETIIFQGCSGEDCYFYILKTSDVYSSLDSCVSSCPTDFFDGYNSCVNSCISQNTNPNPLSIKKSNDLVFNNTCSDKKINLELGADLELEIKEQKQEFKIQGIDSLISNGKDITLSVLNTNESFNKKFDLSLDLVVKGFTELNVKEDVLILNKETNNTVEVKLKDVIIKENSTLDFKYSGTTYEDVYFDFPTIGEVLMNPGTAHSENFKLQLENIKNEGTFNLDIKTGNGKVGNPGSTGHLDGRRGGDSGDVEIIIDEINNLKELNFNLSTGNAGPGGKGLDQKKSKPYVGDIGHGGFGGDAGNLSFNVNTIINNKNSKLELKLTPGNGGDGGDTGRDRGKASGTSNTVHGGFGGNGGSINISQIAKVINNGTFNLSLDAGEGGNGGRKHQHTNDGYKGKGGNAGGINNGDINIKLLENNHIFNIDVKDGFFGYKGLTGQDQPNGNLNETLNLRFDYLINRTKDMKINLITYKENINSNQLFIKTLQTGSYLPQEVKTENLPYIKERDSKIQQCEDDKYQCLDDDGVCEDCCTLYSGEDCISYNQECLNGIPECSACISNYNICLEDLSDVEYTEQNLDNRSILVQDSCYIQKPPSNLNYTTKAVTIKSANQDDFKDRIPSNINKTLTDNPNCSLCDYYDLKEINIMPDNTGYKFSKDYVLYSTFPGQINQNNLFIFYSKNNSEFTKIPSLNPFVVAPYDALYKNKEVIVGEYNQTLGLYEYKVTGEVLEWYYDPLMNLSDKELYCYYQNYRLDGTITSDNGSKSFNFPFTPIFR